mmetsp:Transcript_28567/g.74732  ORF Transcript_28567/g.74732 Transcript_28567/m.74732 type:complete len:562 (-) Transcript_28567:36-1721(-)
MSRDGRPAAAEKGQRAGRPGSARAGVRARSSSWAPSARALPPAAALRQPPGRASGPWLVGGRAVSPARPRMQEGGRGALLTRAGEVHLSRTVEGHQEGRRGLLGDVGVASCREADPVVLAVVGRVVLAKERIPEDEEGPVRRRHVEGHQRHLTPVAAFVDVVLRLEVQDVLPDDEPELRERVVVGAIALHVQPARELVDHVGRASQLGGAGVHGDLAARAEGLGLVVDGDVLDLHLPVPGVAGHGLPEHGRGHVLLLDVPEGDLRALRGGVREEHGEQRLLQRFATEQPVHHAELGALRHLRQGQAEDAVKVERGERVVRLVGGADEADVGAQAADADVVLHEDTTDLARAEGDRDHVPGGTRLRGRPVRLNILRRVGGLAVEAPVHLARPAAAVRGRHHQVATPRVEHDGECLLRGPDLERAVVGRLMHDPVVAAVGLAPHRLEVLVRVEVQLPPQGDGVRGAHVSGLRVRGLRGVRVHVLRGPPVRGRAPTHLNVLVLRSVSVRVPRGSPVRGRAPAHLDVHVARGRGGPQRGQRQAERRVPRGARQPTHWSFVETEKQ